MRVIEILSGYLGIPVGNTEALLFTATTAIVLLIIVIIGIVIINRNPTDFLETSLCQPFRAADAVLDEARQMEETIRKKFNIKTHVYFSVSSCGDCRVIINDEHGDIIFEGTKNDRDNMIEILMKQKIKNYE